MSDSPTLPSQPPGGIEPTLSPSNTAAPVSPRDSLKSRALRSSSVTLLAYGFDLVVRLGGNIVLSWLLARDAFGLLSVVTAINGVILMFLDVGLQPNVVAADREDSRFMNTVWTIQVFQSILFFLLTVIAAYPLSLMYDQPELAYLIPAIALANFVFGFRSNASLLVGRQLRVGRQAVYRGMSRILATEAMILWALIWPSVWALVAGAVTFSLTRMLLSFSLLPGHRVWFDWDKDAARSIFNFGGWLWLNSAVAGVSRAADRMLLPVLIGANWTSMLGVYHFGLMACQIPLEVMRMQMQQVLFPVLAETRRVSEERLNYQVQRALGIIFPLIMFAMYSVMVIAPVFFTFALSEQYREGAAITQLLIIPAWFELVYTSGSAVQMALRDSKRLFFGSVLRIIVLFFGTIICYKLFEFYGFIAALAIGQIAALVWVNILVARNGVHMMVPHIIYSAIFMAFVVIGHGIEHYAVFDLHERLAVLAKASVHLPVIAALAVWALIQVKKRMGSRKPVAKSAS